MENLEAKWTHLAHSRVSLTKITILLGLNEVNFAGQRRISLVPSDLFKW